MKTNTGENNIDWEISDDDIALALQDLSLPNGQLDIEEARKLIDEDEIINKVMEYSTLEEKSLIAHELLVNQLNI